MVLLISSISFAAVTVTPTLTFLIKYDNSITVECTIPTSFHNHRLTFERACCGIEFLIQHTPKDWPFGVQIKYLRKDHPNNNIGSNFQNHYAISTCVKNETIPWDVWNLEVLKSVSNPYPENLNI